MEKFQAQYQVDFQSLNPDLTITFPRLMSYVQETSTRHTQSTRYPMAWYAENMIGWLITNWSIRVTDYPKLGELITIKTYPIGFKGAVGERGFEVLSADGSPLLAAYSSWIYTDLVKMKLMRPPADILEDYGEHFPAPTDKNMDFLPVNLGGSPYELAGKREFLATRRDTDTNYHVNNVKYFEWAFDDIPDDLYDANAAKQVKAVYRRECKAGDSVLSEFYINRSNPKDCVSVFKKAADGGTVMAEIYSLWG